MKVMPINELREKMVLQEAVSSPDGNMILGQGTVLTEHWITRLKDWEIECVKVSQPKADEFDLDSLGDMLKGLMESPKSEAPPKASAKGKFKEVSEAIKKDLRRVFLETRCNKKVPIAEMQRLALLVVQKLLPLRDIIWFVNGPGRGEDYLYRHALDVGIYAGLFAKWLGKSEGEIKEAVYAGLLHDIGKSQVYYEILTKPEGLSAQEMMMAKVHVTHSYRLLHDVSGVPQHIARAIFQHHERLDGEGYPRGLKDESIEPLARVLAIVDVFDALTSDRPYRKAVSQLKAAEIMWQDEGKGLDGSLLQLFITKIREAMLNEEVLLNDGRQGKIAVFQPFPVMKPIVQLLDGSQIDLENEPHLVVKSRRCPEDGVMMNAN